MSTSCEVSAYADDVMVFINKQEDIDKLVENVDHFSKISSAKVNWGKSEALAMGITGGVDLEKRGS